MKHPLSLVVVPGPDRRDKMAEMEDPKHDPDYHGDFVCYDWEKGEVVHKRLTWDDLSADADGQHCGCGHKVAIWRPLFESYVLRERREVLARGVRRSYTARVVDDEVVFRIWALAACYPSADDYVEELRRKLGLED